MSRVLQITGDVHATGAITGGTNTPSDGTVTDAKVAADAAIDPTKMSHRYQPFYGEESATAISTGSHPVYIARGTGTIQEVQLGSVVAATGNATATINIEKNGTEILSADVTLDNANTNFVPEAGTLSDATLSAGDVLEVVVKTASAGTGVLPKGFFAELTIHEATP